MDDKRQKQPAIPEQIAEHLNNLQMTTINKMESFGWQLFFIRRPLFQETVTIMHFPETGETALIEEDGTFNKSHSIYVRN